MSKRKTTEEFVEDAVKIHGHTYDYSLVKYINNSVKVEVVCKIHGSFWQKPNSHLSNKRGCPRCGETGKLTTELFIDKSNKLHPNVYDYSKTKYIDAHSNVIIICKIHGEFIQKAYSHLNGRGCPMCIYRISKDEKEFLDYCKIPNENRQKRVMSYNVDGIDCLTGIIYEFLGDYWHGNIEKYPRSKIHPERKLTYEQLNKETFDRFEKLKKCGYRVKYVWESDWKNFKRGKVKTLKLLEY